MKKLCIIFGGASSEHDISIITGMQLAKNLKAKDIEKIYLGLDNKFYLATKVEELSFFEDKQEIKLKEIIISNNAVYSKSLIFKKLFDIDCVINCCHGGVGENGDLAGFFAVNAIKFTSSNCLSAHITMDKNLTKKLLKGVAPTIKGVLVTKENFDEVVEQIENFFDDNLIVKPNSLGSSIGVKACNKGNFTEQIRAIFELNDDVLVEERVVDIVEYNQACFKTKDGLMFSAIEQPISKHEFLSFDDKYKSKSKAKGSDRIIPAEIDADLENEIIENTSKIYKKLNLNGVVRIDYIYDKATKKLYFNEVNTIPGSMSFYLYEPIGIDYITLIEKIIENAEETKKFTYFDTQILKDKKI